MIKVLDEIPTKIFLSILNQLNDGYVRLDNANGVFMALSVETIAQVEFKNRNYLQISVAHYYTQNGDLMADPEMLFLFNPETPSEIISCYFKIDAIGKEEESIIFDNSVAIGWRKQMQKAHTIFANMWLENIRDQQKINI